jgi:hypothetical protein
VLIGAAFEKYCADILCGMCDKLPISNSAVCSMCTVDEMELTFAPQFLERS